MTARHYTRRTRLKAYYTVPELAELAGCSRVTMWRRLRARGCVLTGAPVPLSTLKVLLADLWESLDLTKEVRQ